MDAYSEHYDSVDGVPKIQHDKLRPQVCSFGQFFAFLDNDNTVAMTDADCFSAQLSHYSLLFYLNLCEGKLATIF